MQWRRIEWRRIGNVGERYPRWLRELAGKSGVYAIRRRGLLFTAVVYVGESHTGSLYKTLTRHFQSWARGKKWWRGQFVAEQTDPGHTYKRDECEVRVQTCSAREALELQAKWIDGLKPRDNVQTPSEELEDAPF